MKELGVSIPANLSVVKDAADGKEVAEKELTGP